jgi:hypothetical protein
MEISKTQAQHDHSTNIVQSAVHSYVLEREVVLEVLEGMC